MVKGTIKNLIFDLGGVVIRFDGEHFMDREGITDPEDRRLLMENLFAGSDWLRLDQGELSEEELLDRAKKKLPARLFLPAERLVLHWAEPAEEVPGMREFILSCRKNGQKTFLLSNAPKSIRKVLDTIRAGDLFDGVVISAETGMKKPDHEIFRYLMEQYGLKAEECLFLDDNKNNVWAARECGMQAAWYREPGEKKLKVVPREKQFPESFFFPYTEESAWFDYDGEISVSPRGSALIIDANGDVFADYMAPAGRMQECTIGENEDEWQPDNFPVEENGNYNYGARAV